MPTTTPHGDTLALDPVLLRQPFLLGKDFGYGLAIYFLSSTVVLLAALVGFEFIEKRVQGPELDPNRMQAPDIDYVAAITRWDSVWYRNITVHGYSWDPKSSSEVAFFPVYPLLVRAAWALANERVELMQVWVAHLMLAFSFVLLSAYARLRLVDANRTTLTLMAFAVFPTTMFFRLGYSESTFFSIILLYCLASERNWPLPILAIICGLATAARPPGIALLPALLLEAYRRSVGPLSEADKRGLIRRFYRWSTLRPFFTRRMLGYAVLGTWGLLSYIAYQWVQFDHPFAFVQTQQNWNPIGGDFTCVVLSVATYEPAWDVYRPDSERYWGFFSEFRGWWMFNLYFANPILFTLVAVLVVWGTRKGVLNRREAVLSLGLMAIPYFTKGFGQSMSSFGRFAAVVVPVYLVMGYLLSKLPSGLAGMIAAFLTFWLIIYAVFFAAGGFPIT